MDNKIILDLVAKNLDEIKLLVDSLRTEEKADPLLIEITVTKAKILYQELQLLLSNEPAIDQKLQIISSDGATSPDEENEVIVEEDINVIIDENEIITTEETTLSDNEDVITQVEETASADEIENIDPEEIKPSNVDHESPTPQEEIIEPEEILEPVNEIEGVSTIVAEIEEETPTLPENEISDNLIDEAPVVEPVSDINQIETPEETEIKDEAETGQIQDSEPDIVENIEIATEEIQEPKIEEITKNELSVNEKLAATIKHEPKVKGIPITNIMNAIGLNDRFLFTRELFTNDSKKFEDTVNHLDQLNNLIEAIEYLEANFKWTKNEASLKFMDLLKRRFEKHG